MQVFQEDNPCKFNNMYILKRGKLKLHILEVGMQIMCIDYDAVKIMGKLGIEGW